MKVQLLVPVRKNSEYFAHFAAAFLTKTKDIANVGASFMMDAADTWNGDSLRLLACFQSLSFAVDSSGLGRWGLHIYYERLAQLKQADWYGLLCEDFEFTMEGWDSRLFGELHNVNMSKPHVYIPRMRSTGSVCHFLNRAWLERSGGIVSEHPSVDSYLNHVIERLPASMKTISPGPSFLDDYTAEKAACPMGKRERVESKYPPFGQETIVSRCGPMADRLKA